MHPQAAVLPADIGLHCTDEELCMFMFLQKLINGSPPPTNVINGVNPYQYMPSNLPPGSLWYLICSNESKDTNLGYWRPKEEACKIFSDSTITGWRTTLEFYEGRAPHERKTNWVMQEYWITYEKVSENSKIKEAGLLCRVQSIGAEPKSNCKNLEKKVTSDVANHFTQPVVPLVEKRTGHASTSKPQVIKDNETGTLTVTERLPDHQIEFMPETEIDFPFGDDYIELLDLDRPASFSSSSDSSCLTISSDECFDSLALLEELETKTSQDRANKNAGCKFSISVSQRPDELVMYAAAASSGSLNKSPSEEMVKSHSSVPSSTVCVKSKEKTTMKLSRNQKPDQRNEGFSNSHTTTPPAGKKATVVKTKKLKKKYLCCLPC
ncbi:NAC domain-containing protein 71-like [Rosa rugosa]|uniref:NAC domain-containing protein 71-like n=1 Tax=Rosa rugosa TaxID=74645 RepID=UPI002B4158BA|nr:NAC domain-containing protein 71-like [Rosa rugosa]XP_062024367.1 NAC domain-containing protein 71-like [Rosa rugosa]